MRALTIKLEPRHQKWLSQQVASLNRSKGSIIRDLIEREQRSKTLSLADALADLRGCISGAKDLSTRLTRQRLTLR